MTFAPAISLIKSVCRLAGSPAYIQNAEAELRHAGVLKAVRIHDHAPIFEWLAEKFAYQGVSDAAAAAFMRENGRPRFHDLEAKLSRAPTCPKLRAHWVFEACAYVKTRQACASPSHFGGCPLPSHRFRNGRLNQTAYSLFLFMRDVAGSDFVRWMDTRLQDAPPTSQEQAEAVIRPMLNIFGVSRKVVSMTLADLFLGAGRLKPRWHAAGATMIAVDTLVHNFFRRTGLMTQLGKPHAYGPACYAAGGCAAMIEIVSAEIDTRAFNTAFPEFFPRFVQHAIWRYCAADEFNVCNGNTVSKGKYCDNLNCRVFKLCQRSLT